VTSSGEAPARAAARSRDGWRARFRHWRTLARGWFDDRGPTIGLGVAFFLSAVMVALPTARVLAELGARPGVRASQAIERREPVPDADLAAGAARLQAALTIDSGNAPLMTHLGRLRLEQAIRDPSGPGQRALINESIAEMRRSLAHAPMRADTWMRYAYALYLSDGYTDEAGEAMMMSHSVGPAEGGYLYFRLAFGMANWEKLSPALRQATLSQAQLMWRYWGEPRQQLIDHYLQLDTPEKLDAVRRAVAQEIAGAGAEEDFLEAVRNRRAALPAN